MSREEALAEPYAELMDMLSYLGAFNGTVKIKDKWTRRISVLDEGFI